MFDFVPEPRIQPQDSCGMTRISKPATCIALLALVLVSSPTHAESMEPADTEPTLGPTSSAPTTVAPVKNTTSNTSTTTTTTTTTSSRPKILACPTICSCTATKVDCEGKQLTQVPKFDPKSCPFVEFRLGNNSLSSIDFRQFPMATIELLDLSDNTIQTFGSSSKRTNELPKLRTLNLSQNKLEALSQLNLWKMPVLETLSLADNLLDKLNASDFVTRTSLKSLDLSRMSELKAIEDNAFEPLAKLLALNLSKSVADLHLPDRLFAQNQALETLDLSYNELVDVPVALRSTQSIKRLYLDGNSMTSLRQSDFVNRKKLELLQVRHCDQLLRVESATFAEMPALKTLIISNNKRFMDFSPSAFMPIRADDQPDGHPNWQEWRRISIDLSANNLTTMSDQLNLPRLHLVRDLRLGENPWDCNCGLQWVEKFLLDSQPLHCASPAKFKDMELSQYFQMVDCQLEESATQKSVLITFLLILILLTVAVFVQRADICRRLHLRDQYGTIYYTKASFPTEQV